MPPIDACGAGSPMEPDETPSHWNLAWNVVGALPSIAIYQIPHPASHAEIMKADSFLPSKSPRNPSSTTLTEGAVHMVLILMVDCYYGIDISPCNVSPSPQGDIQAR